MLETWQIKHKEVINEFLKELNSQTSDYVLKGGTALMKCYNLDRFSEDIDLNSINRDDIQNYIENFCDRFSYQYRVAKYTSYVQRYYINYADISHPLKIEISFREKSLNKDDITKINGITVYTLNALCKQKILAYSSRDRIRDLYDLTFIVNNYFDKLGKSELEFAKGAFMSKGLDYIDYLIYTQKDKLVDENKFIDGVLSAYDKLGLFIEKTDKQPHRQNKKRDNNLEK